MISDFPMTYFNYDDHRFSILYYSVVITTISNYSLLSRRLEINTGILNK